MRKLIYSIVILSVTFAVATPLHAGSSPDAVVPQGWHPDIAEAIDSARQDLKDAKAQMEINSLSRSIADMKDAELFVLYVRLYERLDPKQRQALREEQGRWLKARTKFAEKAIESPGGSLAAYESNTAESEFTDKRIAELTKRLDAFKTVASPF